MDPYDARAKTEVYRSRQRGEETTSGQKTEEEALVRVLQVNRERNERNVARSVD